MNSCTFGPRIADTCSSGPSWWTLPHCLGLAAVAAIVVLAAAVVFRPGPLAWLWDRMEALLTMNRLQRRRAVIRAGLALDLLAAIALAVAVLAGARPAKAAIVPAVTLAIGITCGTVYLYRSRP
jgi:hypothetical protein